MSKKPNIRFKEFSDDWEQRKLGDILVSLQNNTLSRADLSNGVGIAKNVHYGDVLIKFGELLDVSEESLPMISDEGVLTKYKASFLQNGDVIVADTAEDSTVGKCCEIAGLNDEVVLSGLHTIPYRPVKKFASGYLGYYLNSNAYHNQLIPLMQGIKVTSISKSSMLNTDIVYPRALEEQGKIGNYVRSLDHLITLHQRKCDKLKELKKHMLKKMFPKNNEKFPEYRFDGFTDPWEQRKLGEYVSITSGEAPSKFEEGTELYVKVDDLNYNDKYVVDTQNKVAEHSTVKKVTKGSVVFPKRGAAIMTNKVRIMGIDSYMDTNMMALTSEKLDSEFLYNIISKEGLYRIADTSTIPQINNKHVEPYEVTIPSLDEQRRIGTFFKQLDHLITLHQRKVDNLKIFKKFMLKKMFI